MIDQRPCLILQTRILLRVIAVHICLVHGTSLALGPTSGRPTQPIPTSGRGSQHNARTRLFRLISIATCHDNINAYNICVYDTYTRAVVTAPAVSSEILVAECILDPLVSRANEPDGAVTARG